MPEFVEIYHPLLPHTMERPVKVSLSALDDHEARGWLPVDLGVIPPAPGTPYITQDALVSQVSTGTGAVGGALRGAFAHLNETGQLVIIADGVETIVGGSGGGGLTTEQVQDLVASMILEGANVTKVYDDTAGTLTLSAAGGGTTDPEVVRDTIAAALVAGSGVTITTVDGDDTITISVPNSTTTARGIVEMATSAEAVTGTATDLAVTPAGTHAAIAAVAPVQFRDYAGGTWPARGTASTAVKVVWVSTDAAAPDPADALAGDIVHRPTA